MSGCRLLDDQDGALGARRPLRACNFHQAEAAPRRQRPDGGWSKRRRKLERWIPFTKRSNTKTTIIIIIILIIIIINIANTYRVDVARSKAD